MRSREIVRGPAGMTTGTRTRVRRHALLPDRDSWVDIAFTLALSAVALTAFGSSFTGSAYLVVGLLGTVIAVLVTHLTRAAGWPVISAVVICLVLFFLLGLGEYVYTFVTEHRFTNMSALLLSAAVIVFLIGLISEQITNLTYRRDD